MTAAKPPAKPRRDPCLIGDGEPQTCPKCGGSGTTGHGQGKWEATAGGWHSLQHLTPCRYCAGRGVVAAQ